MFPLMIFICRIWLYSYSSSDLFALSTLSLLASLYISCPSRGSSLNLNNPLPIQPPSKHTARPVATFQSRYKKPSTPTSPAIPHPVKVPGLKSGTRQNKYSKILMDTGMRMIIHTSKIIDTDGVSHETQLGGFSNMLSMFLGFCNKR